MEKILLIIILVTSVPKINAQDFENSATKRAQSGVIEMINELKKK
jgi:hypothetical protein